MDELKELMEGLKREIALLKELVKAKDELIHTMKFAPAPIVIREMPQIHIPYVQPIVTPINPWQPPFTITSDSIVNCDGPGNPTNGLYLVNSKAK